jgi:hypothetical protein
MDLEGVLAITLIFGGGTMLLNNHERKELGKGESAG